MGDRFAYVKILGVEHNACDFCIAFYLGEYLRENPEAECVILSRDKKGFDPLVRHLTSERGFKVRRVSAQKEAFSGKVKSWFPGVPATERAGLVDRLFAEGFVHETDKLLTFVSARFRGV